MDPLTGSLISAGTSLLGGIFGGDDGPSPGDTQRMTVAGIMGQAQGAREASEAYGFNPVTLLGVSQPMMGATSTNMMGSAIANAGLAIADGVTESGKLKAYTQALEEQNKDLRKALDTKTLRPDVPGIFSGNPKPVAGEAETVSVDPERIGFNIKRGPRVENAPAEPLWKTFTLSDGTEISLPEGTDLDDVLTGVALEAASEFGRPSLELPVFRTVKTAERLLKPLAQKAGEAVRKDFTRGVGKRQKLPNDAFPGQHVLRPMAWDAWLQ